MRSSVGELVELCRSIGHPASYQDKIRLLVEKEEIQVKYFGYTLFFPNQIKQGLSSSNASYGLLAMVYGQMILLLHLKPSG